MDNRANSGYESCFVHSLSPNPPAGKERMRPNELQLKNVCQRRENTHAHTDIRLNTAAAAASEQNSERMNERREAREKFGTEFRVMLVCVVMHKELKCECALKAQVCFSSGQHTHTQRVNLNFSNQIECI